MWSRVATGSRTIVVPAAARPASRMADLTWALGTLGEWSMAARAAPPWTVTGGRSSPAAARTSAPMARSGARMRPIGRRRSESSPSSVALTDEPASIPVSIRSVVPELPQSRVTAGGRQSAMPGERTANRANPSPEIVRSMSTPSAWRQWAVLAGSSPSEPPLIVELPAAMPASMSARWVIDLSPGTRNRPRNRAAGATIIRAPGASTINAGRRCRHRARRRSGPGRHGAASPARGRVRAPPSGRGTQRGRGTARRRRAPHRGGDGPRP